MILSVLESSGPEDSAHNLKVSVWPIASYWFPILFVSLFLRHPVQLLSPTLFRMIRISLICIDFQKFSSASSRRNSLSGSKLPWPEPSPVRDLPPAAPKAKIKHYPLPPPRYEEGMIALSRRLRNRSASPAPNYSELELSNRPAIVPAALGRPSPSREMIRMTMGGPPFRQYNYGRNIWTLKTLARWM